LITESRVTEYYEMNISHREAQQPGKVEDTYPIVSHENNFIALREAVI